MAADMCMEENAAEACMEVSEQTENSEGVTENDGQVASDGLADNAGENQWESPAEGSSQGQPESDGTATVKLEDGSVVTVTGDWNYFPNGSKVEISSLEIPSPQTFRP